MAAHRLGPLVLETNAVSTKIVNVRVPLQNPARMMEELASVNDTFAAMLDELPNSSPSAPLKMILYGDEVQPNDPLKKATRKGWALYWSLEDFPLHALCDDTAWMKATFVRTSVIKNVSDGAAQLLWIVVRLFYGLLPELSQDMRQGVMIRNRVHCLEVGSLLTDMDAQKLMASITGHNGTKTCPRCYNVMSHRWAGLATSAAHVSSACLDRSKLKPHTRETVRAAQRRVAVAAAAVAARPQPARATTTLANVEQFGGFQYARFNAFCDQSLQFHMTDVLNDDWQHVFFQNGIVIVELNELLDRMETQRRLLNLNAAAFGVQSLASMLSNFVWPKSYASGSTVCESGSFNGTASEQLSSMPVVKRWLSTSVAPTGLLAAEVRSALLLCEVVDGLMLTQSGLIHPAAFQTRIDTFLAAHQAAYGESLWLPKHHRSMHFISQRLHFPCFTLERKHKVPKAILEVRQTTHERFDYNVLEEITVQHLYDVTDRDFTGRPRLCNAHPASNVMLTALREAYGPTFAGDADVQGSTDVVINGRHIHKGDVVLARRGNDFYIAHVWFLFAVGCEIFVCSSAWPFVRSVRDAVEVRRSSQPVVDACVDVLVESVLYRNGANGTALILLPPRYKDVRF